MSDHSCRGFDNRDRHWNMFLIILHKKLTRFFPLIELEASLHELRKIHELEDLFIAAVNIYF